MGLVSIEDIEHVKAPVCGPKWAISYCTLAALLG